MSKKEIMEKDLKSIMAKDIGAKNPIFSPAHISELHAVFALYCDTRLRRTDVRDIILTATTLGLNDTYNMALRVLEDISDANSGNALDFEGFVRELTNRIVELDLFRETLLMKMEGRPLSTCLIWRARDNLTSKI